MSYMTRESLRKTLHHYLEVPLSDGSTACVRKLSVAQVVEIPEHLRAAWNGTQNVGTMEGALVDTLGRELLSQERMGLYILASLVDKKSGDPLFALADFDDIMRLPLTDFQALAQHIIDMNGLSAFDEEAEDASALAKKPVPV